MRNLQADTKEKIGSLVDLMKRQILSGELRAAHVVRVHNEPVLFVHAGFRAKYLAYLQQRSVDITPEGLAEYLNKQLVNKITRCRAANSACQFDDEAFEAGPERGGDNIGGPFWTDFAVLKAAEEGQV